MNRKTVGMTLLIAAFFLFVAVMSGFSQDDVTKVRDSAFGIRDRKPVAFVHDAHNEKAGIGDCAVCHHVYDKDGKKLEAETSEELECSDCHLSGEKKGRMDLTRAYHLRCKGCHEEKKAGPVMCGECHRDA